MSRIFLFCILVYLLQSPIILSQDLDSLLQEELGNKSQNEYVQAIFKGGRIVLGQSIENKAKGELDFIISHHFGNLNSGAYNFFGLDHSEIRLGFDYGIAEWLTIGIGRSSYNKIFDGFLKLKLLRQSKGKGAFPISVSVYSNMALNSIHWAEPERENRFDSRLTYAFELLLARKINSSFSVQLIPAMVHRNLVETIQDQNDVFALGLGGRLKLSKRLSINGEYNYVLPGKAADDFYNSLSIGIDIETGGHVFQLFFTNSNGFTEQYFIAGSTGNWLNGDVKLGFNISRNFSLIKKKNIDFDNF